MDNPVIKNANHEDLDMIARCHRSAFPGSLSSAMGQSYVKRMLSWYLTEKSAFLFFLVRHDTCIGYCGGMVVDGKAPIGSASGMTQHSFDQGLLALGTRPWLFFHPEFVSKYRFALKNLVRRIQRVFGELPPKNFATPHEPHVGLVVIGVLPVEQGKGYGSQLLSYFEDRAQARGYKNLMLTVLSENFQAIRAYQKSGWSIKEVQGKSTTMVKRLV